MHLLKGPSDLYTTCGKSIDKVIGSFDIHNTGSNGDKVTRDTGLVTCPECNKQLQILTTRMKEYDAIQGIRVGDWIQEPNGRLTRATYDWGDSIQNGGSANGQFYLGDGYISYSGSLDPSIPKENLEPTGEFKNGRVWFFKDDYHTAHNGIDFVVPFRVYRFKGPKMSCPGYASDLCRYCNKKSVCEVL